jgi:hypothetical protein
MYAEHTLQDENHDAEQRQHREVRHGEEEDAFHRTLLFGENNRTMYVAKAMVGTSKAISSNSPGKGAPPRVLRDHWVDIRPSNRGLMMQGLGCNSRIITTLWA